jgi:hypothetical protein
MNSEEAKDALGEYLEEISPFFKKENKLSYFLNYTPLIAVKLTEEQLQTLNKNDEIFILVVRELDSLKNNYWITSPFERGFVYSDTPSKKYFRWMELHGEMKSISMLKMNINTWDEQYDKTIGQMLNNCFGSQYTYYLLNPSPSFPTTTRTLNFSKRGFMQ